MEKINLTDLPDRYFFADLASGKKQQVLRRVRARQAIVGVAPYYLKNRRRLLFVIYAWAGRIPTPEFKDKIISVGNVWHPRLFGIESNAMQSLFADLVIDEAKTQKLRIPLVPVEQSTKVDKDWRIRTALQSEIANHNIYLLHSQTELLTEITGFPLAATKDIIDALASAVTLVPQRSHQAQESDERDALAEHLRLSGCSPKEIERRVYGTG